MSRKRHKPEEIVAKLRQVEVLVAQGTPVADAVRSIGVTEVASGRVAGWGDLLLSAGGPSCDRELETSLQCPAPPCLARLPPAGSGGVRARLCCMAGCAHPTSSAGHALGGAQANPELTFNPDHQLGADHDQHVYRVEEVDGIKQAVQEKIRAHLRTRMAQSTGRTSH